MPVHSLILMSTSGDILYKTHFLQPAILDHTSQLYFEQRLYKATAPLWASTASAPFSLAVGDVMVVCQRIGEIVAFLSGVDDTDEPILMDVVGVIDKVLQELLDGKVTEAGLLVPENLGKFVVSMDDLMPLGIVETLDAGLVGRLSKLKAIS